MKEMIYTNEVYNLRKKIGVSQYRMSEDLGISRRALSKIENGEQNLSLAMAYRISAYFNCIVTEVFPLQAGNQLTSYATTTKKERIIG